MEPQTDEQAVQSPPDDPQDPAQEHPAHDAHGGSMAPGQVDDTGNPTSDLPPGTPDK
jgi:hypothetical protein